MMQLALRSKSGTWGSVEWVDRISQATQSCTDNLVVGELLSAAAADNLGTLVRRTDR